MSDEKLNQEEIDQNLTSETKEKDTSSTENEVSEKETTNLGDALLEETAAKADTTNTANTAEVEADSENLNAIHDLKSEVAETEIADKTTSQKNSVETVTNKPNEETHAEDEEEITSSEEDDSENDEEQKDYSGLSQKQLVEALEKLLKDKPANEIKTDVEEIRAEFNAQFEEELETKKEEFLAAGGNIIDFQYSSTAKKQFGSLYFDYKEKRNNHYKSLKKDLNANLEKRQALIEELKGLWNAEENINTTYNHFKNIQEQWRNAGAIPRDKYNLVWNNFHHHVETFYDYLHLNREFRDQDFKNNLEQKLKVIGRAEELAQEQDINKAFRELQMLHKMWKEDIGPVAKEYRDDVWDKFSEATKKIHDKRQDQLNEREQEFQKNLEIKLGIISEIETHATTKADSHNAWQNTIKKVQELRDAYFKTGPVPRADNKNTWKAFKDVTAIFNKSKNNFYKLQKQEQYDNLEKKRELIKIAEENKDNEDAQITTPLFKKIQADWKKIGHVPRKDSDKVWKLFKNACNHYFEGLKAQKAEASKEDIANYEAKTEMLKNLENLEFSGNHKEDLVTIKQKIAAWKEIGRVPYDKRVVEEKFNKVLDGFFAKLDLGKKETELIKFENKLSSMVSQEDERKLQNEHFFISKKIEETRDEIRQLENNLGFFHHVKADNPLVKEVHNNIAKHKEQLDVWEAKLTKIKSARNDSSES